MDNIPCCPDSPLCQPPAEPAARAIWHLEQERLERAWLDDHITAHLAVSADESYGRKTTHGRTSQSAVN